MLTASQIKARGNAPGLWKLTLPFPEAMDINNVPDVIEGWRSCPSLEEKGVDRGHRTTIGFLFEFLMNEGPMVHGCVYPLTCPRLWYYRLSAFSQKLCSNHQFKSMVLQIYFIGAFNFSVELSLNIFLFDVIPFIKLFLTFCQADKNFCIPALEV